MAESQKKTGTGESSQHSASLGPRGTGEVSARRPVRFGGRRVRLDDAITYFLSEWASEGPTRDTARSYGDQLKWLVGFATRRGTVMLADLTPELLRAAMSAKMSTAVDRSPNFKGGESSAKCLASATRSMARWLLAQGVPVHDLKAVKAPRAPERVQPRVRQDEFQAIETAILRRLVSPSRRIPRVAIARDLALVYLLGDTGLRANEVCSMDVRDVDFTTGSIMVVRGKGKKQRALSIVDAEDATGGTTLRLLSDWIQTRAAVTGAARTNRLWVSMKGRPFSREQLRRILARICADAGIDSNRPPHAFRRASFTESYLASPSSIRVLAARMGWSPKSHHMIDTYTRGVEVELARTTPVPSVSARWHESTIPAERPRPILIQGVGPGTGHVERAAPPRRVGKEGNRPPARPDLSGRRTQG